MARPKPSEFLIREPLIEDPIEEYASMKALSMEAGGVRGATRCYGCTTNFMSHIECEENARIAATIACLAIVKWYLEEQ